MLGFLGVSSLQGGGGGLCAFDLLWVSCWRGKIAPGFGRSGWGMAAACLAGWVFIGYEGRVHWTKRAQGELELAGSSAPSTLGVRPYCLLLSGGAGEDGAGPPGPVGTWLVCGLLAVLRVSDGLVNLWAHLAVTWVRLTL